MTNELNQEKVQNTLNRLYQDSKERNIRLEKEFDESKVDRSNPKSIFEAKIEAYMAICYESGKLLYNLIQTSKSVNILEFGTSFGVSTIYMAAALKANGGNGKVITTEYFQEKADEANTNLSEAGLNEYVDIRVGDAMETLGKDLPEEIDFIFLDGAKSMYFDVLKLIEPKLKQGAIVVGDNVNHSGMENFLEYLQDEKSGYISTMVTANGENRQGHHIIAIKQ